MSGLKGDFIGFTFDNIHSSTLGVVRTSEGSRYSEDLLPSIEDKTVRVPGGHGYYYFGTYYTGKNFNISIAFDNLTEPQYRRLRQHFNGEKVGELIFDEAPYKVYRVKVNNSPNLKYICFDDEKGERIYKGEGTFSFTAYTPFARSRYKWLSDYTSIKIPEWTNKKDYQLVDTSKGFDSSMTYYIEGLYGYRKVDISKFTEDTDYYVEVDSIGNQQEWAAASGLLKEQGKFDTYVNDTIFVYNPGDLETDFILSFVPPQGKMTLSIGGNPKLNIDTISLEEGDSKVQINSKTELIEGLNKEGKLTGSIYNKYIVGGSFFKIPKSGEEGEILTLVSGLEDVEIKYDYLYF